MLRIAVKLQKSFLHQSCPAAVHSGKAEMAEEVVVRSVEGRSTELPSGRTAGRTQMLEDNLNNRKVDLAVKRTS